MMDAKSTGQMIAAGFTAVFNSPDMIADREKRERERLMQLAELLKRYPSEEAVLAETDDERALIAAFEPFIRRKPVKGCQDAWHISYVGWTGGDAKSMSPKLRRKIEATVPLPQTVAATWAEYRTYKTRTDERCIVFPDYTTPDGIRARQYILEEMLDTLPGRTREDLFARLAWLASVAAREWQRGNDEDMALASRLRKDVEVVLGAAP